MASGLLRMSDLSENQQYRVERGDPLLPDDLICEWCKGEIKMMVQKGTGVCSQNCAELARHILYSSEEKAIKFGGGWSGPELTPIKEPDA